MTRCKRARRLHTFARVENRASVAVMNVTETPPPPDSLMAAYATREGYYTDCFEVACDRDVPLADYIRAFYTQPLFRAERWVLRLAARAPSSDRDVDDLADGRGTRLAVWEVEARRENEVMMEQSGGRTLSWLQVGPGVLRFGSVVVPVQGRGGTLTLGPVFQSLLGAHKLYSRALLAGAARRV